jgi:hypothetical protein
MLSSRATNRTRRGHPLHRRRAVRENREMSYTATTSTSPDSARRSTSFHRGRSLSPPLTFKLLQDVHEAAAVALGPGADVALLLSR